MEECNHNQIPKSKIYNLMSIIMIPTLLIKSLKIVSNLLMTFQKPTFQFSPS